MIWVNKRFDRKKRRMVLPALSISFLLWVFHSTKTVHNKISQLVSFISRLLSGRGEDYEGRRDDSQYLGGKGRKENLEGGDYNYTVRERMNFVFSPGKGGIAKFEEVKGDFNSCSTLLWLHYGYTKLVSYSSIQTSHRIIIEKTECTYSVELTPPLPIPS